MQRIRHIPQLMRLFDLNTKDIQNDILNVLDEQLMQEVGSMYAYQSDKHANKENNYWLKILSTCSKISPEDGVIREFVIPTNNEFAMWRLVNMMYDYASEINTMYPKEVEWFHFKDDTVEDVISTINLLNQVIDLQIEQSVITDCDRLNARYRSRPLNSDDQSKFQSSLSLIFGKLINTLATGLSESDLAELNAYRANLDKRYPDGKTIDENPAKKPRLDDDKPQVTTTEIILLDPDQPVVVRPVKIYILPYDD